MARLSSHSLSSGTYDTHNSAPTSTTQKQPANMDALFAKTTFRFEIEDTITRWSLDKIIAEDFDTNNGWPCVAAGVFECHHVDPTKDDDILEAIIKVYVQMPHSEDNGEINVTPYDETPQWVRSEIKALKLISTLPIEDCPGPRFLSSRHPKQSDEMWLPGGCCCAILMTKVLGETLGPTKYRTWPQAKRAEIYDAFAKSFK